MATLSVGLPIDGIVSASVAVNQSAAQSQSTSSLLVMTPNTQIDLITRIASFPSLAAVGTYFGTNGPEYAAAQLWFGQSPQPTEIQIATWAQTARAGQLLCGTLNATQQAMSNFSAIADGGFSIAVDGGESTHVSGIVLTGVGNLNAVATAINTALTTATLGVSCIWSAPDARFVFTSATTGAESSVSFLSAGAGGSVTDIFALIGAGVAGGGFQSPGQVAETALAAVTLLDNDFGESWYALQVPTAATADHLAIAAFIQATDTKHFYGVTSSDSNILLASSTTDVASELSALGVTKTAVQYSSYSDYAIASLLGRILTVDYSANSSTITTMFKQEPLVPAETVNKSMLAALLAKNCNIFVNYKGGVTIIQPGTTSTKNQWIDAVIGVDNVAITVQSAVFNALYTSLTKIPQTDAGMHTIIAVIENVLLEFVADGLIAPGVWNQAGFGSLNQGDTLDKGYYIYAPPVATQLESDRASRLAVPVQIAIKLAGAIQQVAATISVNP